MKYFFIVQGEGMGHTTQSLALRSMLEKNGHTVTNTFLGTNFFRSKNEFYRLIEHECFYSPVFLSRRDKTGINLFATFLYNLFFSPLYIITILHIAYRIKKSDADAVVVFYDFIGQSGAFLSFSGKPVFSISHHFFFGHPSFRMPPDRKTEQFMLTIHSKLASFGARKKLALSFTKEKSIPQKRLHVVPPLLRQEILESQSIAGDHVHIYCLHPGFLNSIIILALRYPGKRFRIFLHELKKKINLPVNMELSLISGDRFLESMRTSDLVICTAGFETLAEAIFLNKPLVIIPSRGHFEQYCNSLDALRAKAARAEESFNVQNLPSFKYNQANPEFMRWIDGAEEIFMNHLTE